MPPKLSVNSHGAIAIVVCARVPVLVPVSNRLWMCDADGLPSPHAFLHRPLASDHGSDFESDRCGGSEVNQGRPLTLIFVRLAGSVIQKTWKY